MNQQRRQVLMKKITSQTQAYILSSVDAKYGFELDSLKLQIQIQNLQSNLNKFLQILIESFNIVKQHLLEEVQIMYSALNQFISDTHLKQVQIPNTANYPTWKLKEIMSGQYFDILLNQISEIAKNKFYISKQKVPSGRGISKYKLPPKEKETNSPSKIQVSAKIQPELRTPTEPKLIYTPTSMIHQTRWGNR